MTTDKRYLHTDQFAGTLKGVAMHALNRWQMHRGIASRTTGEEHAWHDGQARAHASTVHLITGRMLPPNVHGDEAYRAAGLAADVIDAM